MKISEFAVHVARLEKGKKEVSIAQIKEIIKVINFLTAGILYRYVRKL